MTPKENWRDSEVQVIGPRVWHKLNGTDAEILIPDATAATLIRVRRAAQSAGLVTTKLPAPVTEPGVYRVGFTADGQVQFMTKVDE